VVISVLLGMWTTSVRRR